MFNRKIGTISWKMHYPYEGMYPASDIEYIEKTVTGNGYVDLLTAKRGSLSSLVLSGGTEQRNVPEGYTELDYIRNVMNSTKFNTGLSPQNGDVLELVRTAGTPTVSNYMFQSREGTQAGIYGISGSSSGGTIMGNRGSGQSLQSEILRVAGHKYYTRMSVIGTTLTLTVKDLTDRLENTKTREITDPTPGPSKYFLWGNATQTQALGTAQSVYFASITTNGVERIKLIPAKQGDTVGFYDMVSKTFMSTFVGDTPTGSTTEVIPSPFVPIDIVSNNGTLKCSKNLLNLEDLEGSYLLTDSGQRGSSNDSWFLTNFIKVKPSTSYVFDFISGGDYVYRRICGYSSNDYNTFTELLIKKGRPTTENERYSLQFTTGATTNYIKISSHRFDTNIQLIEGTQAIPYHKYGIYTEGTIETVKDSSNRTATAEKLLKIGDYVDSQEVLSGAIARNVGVKVLDGTESWNMYSVTQGNLFRIILNDSVSNNKVQLGVLCNYYSVVDTSDRVSGTLSGTTTNYDFINDDYTTIDEWKAYLASEFANGTPVIIVYPLATATTETVTGQNLNVKSGTNKIEIVQASIDNLGISATYLSRE